MGVRVSPEETSRLVRYLWQGLTAQQIAHRENMPYETVKSRIQRVYQDHGVNSRAQLVSLIAERERELSARADLITEESNALLRGWLRLEDPTDAVADALRLAFDVRTGAPERIRSQLRHQMIRRPERLEATLLTLAALVPLDRSPINLLRWLTDRDRSYGDGRRPVNGQRRPTR